MEKKSEDNIPSSVPSPLPSSPPSVTLLSVSDEGVSTSALTSLLVKRTCMNESNTNLSTSSFLSVVGDWEEEDEEEEEMSRLLLSVNSKRIAAIEFSKNRKS